MVCGYRADFQVVGREFTPQPGHNKDHHENVQTASLLGIQAFSVGIDSAT